MERGAPDVPEVYRRVRAATEALAAPLAVEDQVVQSMPEVSPTKWHLAHTSWFFETFVLRPGLAGYRSLDERYATFWNSYYVAAGERIPQQQRGMFSRPTVAEVLAYRAHVDAAMLRFLERPAPALLAVVELGLNHEEQHQELVLTDIAHVLAQNPLEPTYRDLGPGAVAEPGAPALGWKAFPAGTVEIGAGPTGFAFDNERPRHTVVVRPFALATRSVTVAEWLAFIADGGYARPDLWLSDGWEARVRGGWEAPLYWRTDDRSELTLLGRRPLEAATAVAHVSFYEADAYARWAGLRLPDENEWELAAASETTPGALLESERLRPGVAGTGLSQMIGDVWEWTASPYLAYPGFHPLAGALGEYNGKFMSNRIILRGGSCFTPTRHIRRSYRNFWVPETRWQMTGLRLARDA